MALATQQQVDGLITSLTQAWRRGSGADFGACFTGEAHFVAFDGTVLAGPKAIAEYHQGAFDRYLNGTELLISIEQSSDVADCALLLFINGMIQSVEGKRVMLTGESLAMLVVVLRGGEAKVQAFQNTRKRPIQDERSASAWKTFDELWAERDPQSV